LKQVTRLFAASSRLQLIDIECARGCGRYLSARIVEVVALRDNRQTQRLLRVIRVALGVASEN